MSVTLSPSAHGAGTNSFFQMLQNKESIWVVNTTPGLLVLSLQESGMASIKIPEGADPVCITEGIPTKDLEESRDLRIAINKGGLKVLTEAEAQKYYEENQGRLEVVKEKIRRLQQLAQSEPQQMLQEQAEITPRIRGLVQELNQNMPVEVAIQELERKIGQWTISDLTHLRSNAKQQVIQLWAEEQLRPKVTREANQPLPQGLPKDIADSMGRP